MLNINISEEFKAVCPHFRGAALRVNIKNSEFSEQLWNSISNLSAQYKSENTIDGIKKHPVIEATRNAYKSFGKDPNRYRPSSEALCRRIMRDLPLYKINTVVDIINLVSIRSGYSIGGFDADRIKGDTLTLGIGKTDEPYESIGRGMLNIEGLPVYRDLLGGVGTPTSDNERTKLHLDTTNLLIIFNGYNGKDGLNNALELALSLLKEFAEAENEEVIFF